MAGDWIKMRNDLAEDPAVIGMAAVLEIDEDSVVGKLHKLWSWADRQSRDGHADGVTNAWIDRYVRCDGFASAMQAVRWMVIDVSGMTIPNFDRHNGESAKTRALSNKRQQKKRASVTQDETNTSRNERDKSVTREEKRREESNTGAPAPTPARKKSIKTEMPEDFVVSARVEAWAGDKGFNRLDEHLESFRRKCAANGYKYIDWDGAFMEAIREDWAKLRGKQGNNGATGIGHFI